MQLNMQQREQGLRRKSKAKSLEVTFPAGSHMMAGQLVCFKLPTRQDGGWQAQLGSDSVSLVTEEDSCICCLDVQAPSGISVQTRKLQVTQNGEDGLQFMAPGLCFAG